ncbi:MAG: hypothetical protein NTX45_25705 [Proteobacteria bacterium]|nr:hypothetical protein [Pseudomonadota bacterium]
MITIVVEDNQITIPDELARECNIKAGTQLDWSKNADGSLRIKPLTNRGELARRLAGIGRQWLKSGNDPIADLIRERVAEDEEIG